MTEERLKSRYLKEDEAAIDAAIAALLKHYEGRKFLWWLLQIGGVGQQPYTGNALGTAFNCGTLDVGNKFLARIISVSPDGYVTMMKEMADERGKRDRELDGARNGRGKQDNGSDDFDDGGGAEVTGY